MSPEILGHVKSAVATRRTRHWRQRAAPNFAMQTPGKMCVFGCMGFECVPIESPWDWYYLPIHDKPIKINHKCRLIYHIHGSYRYGWRNPQCKEFIFRRLIIVGGKNSTPFTTSFGVHFAVRNGTLTWGSVCVFFGRIGETNHGVEEVFLIHMWHCQFSFTLWYSGTRILFHNMNNYNWLY